MAPKLFRIALQVSDLDKAASFYRQLLGEEGSGYRRYLQESKPGRRLLEHLQGEMVHQSVAIEVSPRL